ncbi:RNA-binding domain-containing protein [Penicillium cosmopolitanum]|uniref:RNA-binding domain-containing protein n=1 Tax=Penicillium cosmopolitanum TaxID=1131564 RepID=A0A9X0BA09_9EURO|nr:RNA-binding domain-containing protein [Penicillium cosmopolitanum]KAJ5397263.1 RNA-binding domain-containing protein [Penicillium cosmopolitanum]
MSGARHWEQDKEATVYIGNLDERASDSLVWELMLQAGRIVNVHLPKDRVTQSHQGYGFVEFISEEDAEYASRVMNGIRLFGKPIRVNKASADKQKSVEIGAELFVGNLDPMVSEQMLYDTFGRFGNLVNLPKVARDDNSLSKGYGFVSFADFESSDSAIANMNGQILMNKQVTVQYAYKKDGKGERHGDEAERMLASQARKHNIQQPTQQIVVPPPEDLQEFQMVTAHGPSALAPHRLLIWERGEVCLRWDIRMFLLLRKCEPRRLVLLPPSLAAPPPGLPARPPPSQVGYGGPQAYGAPGYNAAPQQPPPGFAPPGFGPPTGATGAPPPLPPGFQQPGYGNGR